MERLKRKLKSTLHLVTLAADQSPGANMYMEHLGKLHERLQIQPDFYALWQRSLVDTAAECDPAFSTQARSAWEAVIEYTVALMIRPVG